MKKQMKKSTTISVVILTLLFSMFYLNFEASAYYELSWHETQSIELQKGDNWFEIELESFYGIDLFNIYFEVTTEGSYQDLYVELYNNELTRLTGDYRDFTSNYCLAQQFAKTGRYYLYISAPRDWIYADITTDKYSAKGDAADMYEPNNRAHFATPLEITTDTIITGDLGQHREDVDFYAYTVTEPCMLEVDLIRLNDEADANLSIFVGDSLAASTDSWETPLRRIKNFPYFFNHTHGVCYFKVYDAFGEYELKITKHNYEAEPVLYNISPSQRQLYSEFDILTPKMAALANGKLRASYLHVRNGETYNSINGEITANDKTFTEFQFPDLLPSQVSNTGEKTQNDIQFMAKNITGIGDAETVSVVLNYDNKPPAYKDVILETSENSIEVTVLEANDEKGLAQKPYRYRIYPSGETPPEYSEWLTKNCYYMGFENGTELTAGEYIVDVQIRDRIAENVQSSTQDLSNHILTITKTGQVG